MASTQKTIEVIIDKTGDTHIEVSGFTGKECLKETKSIEEALTKSTVNRKMKSDASKSPVIADKALVGGKR